jgi:putative tryptophan/tyrosine transport system substrate-binding protein
VLRLPATPVRLLICFASGVHAILLGSCLAACAPTRSEVPSGPGSLFNRRPDLPVCGVVTWPAVARAQQAHPVIGFLGINSPEGLANVVAGFRKGLSETGFVEGRNVLIEFRWAGGQFDRMPALIADLVRDRVAVIFASAPSAVRAAQAQTVTIPIVFHMGEDPVKEGVVASLNRPGANVTGVSDFANQLAGKRLSPLRDMVPKAAVYALLVRPSHPNAESDTEDARAAAQALGLDLRVLTADNEREIDAAFATMTQLRVGALFVNIDPFFTERHLGHRDVAILFQGGGGLDEHRLRPFRRAGGHGDRLALFEHVSDENLRRSNACASVVHHVGLKSPLTSRLVDRRLFAIDREGHLTINEI